MALQKCILFLLIPVLCLAQIPNLYRLPGTTKPEHYDLDMRINVDSQSFKGTVKIKILVVEETSSVVLHFKDMDISRAELHHDEVQIPLNKFSSIPEYEMLTMDFEPLTVGESYILTLDYSASIRTDLKGLYMSYYYNEEGEKREMATTFMAPNYARMAFPCYDEPIYKANYTIHITHASKYFALSNMPVDKEEPQTDGWIKTTFKESLPTSTYIVAFIVTDFVKTVDPDSGFTIYSQPAVARDTAYALEYAQVALKHMEQYVDRQYQYPKWDWIAIDDFLMGAMENWGLITYLSSRILITNQTDIKSLIANSKTMTHEIAHQWFGNEVSHVYWYAVWLKEGLATLFEDFITDEINPSWRMMEQFVLNTMQFVMQQDCFRDSRAMTKSYETPAEIRRVYDYVTYKKAGSIMRMMQNVITPTIFRRGLSVYIERNSFSTASPEDLVDAWQFAVNEIGNPNDLPPIDAVFNSWINAPGFPYLIAQRNYETGNVTLSQTRFVSSYSNSFFNTYRYTIPVNYVTQKSPDFSDTKPQYWLWSAELSKEIEVEADNNEWVIFNKQATGYYRVLYDTENYRLLSNALRNDNDIIPVNRAQLIDDALNLAKFDYLDFRVALDLVSYIKNETDVIPISSALTNLRELERSARGTDLDIEWYLRDLIDNLYETYSLQKTFTTTLEQVLQMEVVNFACKYGHENCTADAYSMFNDTLPNGNFPSNLRSAILCGAIKYKGVESERGVYNALRERLMLVSEYISNRRFNSREVLDIIDAFSCFEDREFQDSVLDMSLVGISGASFEDSDFNRMFSAIASGSESGTMRALLFMARYFTSQTLRYGSMPPIFEALGKNVVTEEQSDLFNAIYEAHIDPEKVSFELEKAATEAKEMIGENLKWKEKNAEEVRLYLKEYRGSAVQFLISRTLIFIVLAIMLRKLL